MPSLFQTLVLNQGLASEPEKDVLVRSKASTGKCSERVHLHDGAQYLACGEWLIHVSHCSFFNESPKEVLKIV